MPDSEQTIKIQIVTSADTAGLKQTSDALKQLSNAEQKNSSALPKNVTEAGYGRDIGIGLLVTLIVEAIYGLRESIQDLAGRKSPESEGLENAAEQQREAMEKAELAARAYERSLKRVYDANESMANRITGETNSQSFQLPDNLREKLEAAKKTAGAAAFAAGEFVADAADLKKAQEKLQQLQEEHQELLDKTSTWGAFTTLKPQFVLNRILKQNETEQAAIEHLVEQRLKKIDQDRVKKLKAADAANRAQEELAILEDSLLKVPPPVRTKSIPPSPPVAPATEPQPHADKNFGEPGAFHIDLGTPAEQLARAFAPSLTPDQADAVIKALASEGGDAAKIRSGHGGEVSSESQNTIQTLGSIIAGHSVTLQQAADIVAKADSSNTNLLAALQAFDATANAMKTNSSVSKQKFEEVTATLKEHARAIANLNGRSPQPPPP